MCPNGTNGTMVLSLAAQQSEKQNSHHWRCNEIGAPNSKQQSPNTGTQVTGVASIPGGTPLAVNLTSDILQAVIQASHGKSNNRYCPKD